MTVLVIFLSLIVWTLSSTLYCMCYTFDRMFSRNTKPMSVFATVLCAPAFFADRILRKLFP